MQSLYSSKIVVYQIKIWDFSSQNLSLPITMADCLSLVNETSRQNLNHKNTEAVLSVVRKLKNRTGKVDKFSGKIFCTLLDICISNIKQSLVQKIFTALSMILEVDGVFSQENMDAIKEKLFTLSFKSQNVEGTTVKPFFSFFQTLIQKDTFFTLFFREQEKVLWIVNNLIQTNLIIYTEFFDFLRVFFEGFTYSISLDYVAERFFSMFESMDKIKECESQYFDEFMSVVVSIFLKCPEFLLSKKAETLYIFSEDFFVWLSTNKVRSYNSRLYLRIYTLYADIFGIDIKFPSSYTMLSTMLSTILTNNLNNREYNELIPSLGIDVLYECDEFIKLSDEHNNYNYVVSAYLEYKPDKLDETHLVSYFKKQEKESFKNKDFSGIYSLVPVYGDTIKWTNLVDKVYMDEVALYNRSDIHRLFLFLYYYERIDCSNVFENQEKWFNILGKFASGANKSDKDIELCIKTIETMIYIYGFASDDVRISCFEILIDIIIKNMHRNRLFDNLFEYMIQPCPSQSMLINIEDYKIKYKFDTRINDLKHTLEVLVGKYHDLPVNMCVKKPVCNYMTIENQIRIVDHLKAKIISDIDLIPITVKILKYAPDFEKFSDFIENNIYECFQQGNEMNRTFFLFRALSSYGRVADESSFETFFHKVRDKFFEKADFFSNVFLKSSEIISSLEEAVLDLSIVASRIVEITVDFIDYFGSKFHKIIEVSKSCFSLHIDLVSNLLKIPFPSSFVEVLKDSLLYYVNSFYIEQRVLMPFSALESEFIKIMNLLIYNIHNSDFTIKVLEQFKPIQFTPNMKKCFHLSDVNERNLISYFSTCSLLSHGFLSTLQWLSHMISSGLVSKLLYDDETKQNISENCFFEALSGLHKDEHTQRVFIRLYYISRCINDVPYLTYDFIKLFLIWFDEFLPMLSSYETNILKRVLFPRRNNMNKLNLLQKYFVKIVSSTDCKNIDALFNFFDIAYVDNAIDYIAFYSSAGNQNLLTKYLNLIEKNKTGVKLTQTITYELLLMSFKKDDSHFIETEFSKKLMICFRLTLKILKLHSIVDECSIEYLYEYFKTKENFLDIRLSLFSLYGKITKSVHEYEKKVKVDGFVVYCKLLLKYDKSFIIRKKIYIDVISILVRLYYDTGYDFVYEFCFEVLHALSQVDGKYWNDEFLIRNIEKIILSKNSASYTTLIIERIPESIILYYILFSDDKVIADIQSKRTLFEELCRICSYKTINDQSINFILTKVKETGFAEFKSGKIDIDLVLDVIYRFLVKYKSDSAFMLYSYLVREFYNVYSFPGYTYCVVKDDYQLYFILDRLYFGSSEESLLALEVLYKSSFNEYKEFVWPHEYDLDVKCDETNTAQKFLLMLGKRIDSKLISISKTYCNNIFPYVIIDSDTNIQKCVERFNSIEYLSNNFPEICNKDEKEFIFLVLQTILLILKVKDKDYIREMFLYVSNKELFQNLSYASMCIDDNLSSYYFSELCNDHENHLYLSYIIEAIGYSRNTFSGVYQNKSLDLDDYAKMLFYDKQYLSALNIFDISNNAEMINQVIDSIPLNNISMERSHGIHSFINLGRWEYNEKIVEHKQKNHLMSLYKVMKVICSSVLENNSQRGSKVDFYVSDYISSFSFSKMSNTEKISSLNDTVTVLLIRNYLKDKKSLQNLYNNFDKVEHMDASFFSILKSSISLACSFLIHSSDRFSRQQYGILQKICSYTDCAITNNDHLYAQTLIGMVRKIRLENFSKIVDFQQLKVLYNSSPVTALQLLNQKYRIDGTLLMEMEAGDVVNKALFNYELGFTWTKWNMKVGLYPRGDMLSEIISNVITPLSKICINNTALKNATTLYVSSLSALLSIYDQILSEKLNLICSRASFFTSEAANSEGLDIIKKHINDIIYYSKELIRHSFIIFNLDHSKVSNMNIAFKLIKSVFPIRIKNFMSMMTIDNIKDIINQFCVHINGFNDEALNSVLFTIFAILTKNIIQLEENLDNDNKHVVDILIDPLVKICLNGPNTCFINVHCIHSFSGSSFMNDVYEKLINNATKNTIYKKIITQLSLYSKFLNYEFDKDVLTDEFLVLTSSNNVVVKDIISFDIIEPNLKLVRMIGSDGCVYSELLKKYHDIYSEYISEFAKLFLSLTLQELHKELSIRSYKILPYAHEEAIISHIPHTDAIRQFLNKSELLNELEKEYTEEVDINKFKSIQSRAKSLIEVKINFFLLFRTPREWFIARNNYIHSTAANSITGFLLSVPQRNLYNILFDSKSGEVIHINLQNAFNKNRLLSLNEHVPFRFTQIIRDGFGNTNGEGVFRNSCIDALNTLQSNKQHILNLIEILNLEDNIHNEIESTFTRSSQDPVTNVVNKLISDSLDCENLYQMDQSWEPYI